jgi:hypothetical protein
VAQIPPAGSCIKLGTGSFIGKLLKIYEDDGSRSFVSFFQLEANFSCRLGDKIEVVFTKTPGKHSDPDIAKVVKILFEILSGEPEDDP